MELARSERKASKTRLRKLHVEVLGKEVELDILNSKVNEILYEGEPVEGLKPGQTVNGFFLPLLTRAPGASKVFSAFQSRVIPAHIGGFGRSVIPGVVEKLGRLLLRAGAINNAKLEGDDWENISDRERERVISSVGFGQVRNVLADLNRDSQAPLFESDTFGLSEAELEEAQKLMILRFLPRILFEADKEIANFSIGVKYLGPLRAVADRFYRMQDLAVEEIDSKGGNLAMWIESLSDGESEKFGDWLASAAGFEVFSRGDGAHRSIEIGRGNERLRNLVDTGFGFSQVLPVLATLWGSSSLRRSRTTALAIEQPELHLHPSLQATVGRALADPILGKHELKLFVETHSEALINGLGRSFGPDGIDPASVQILMVEPSELEGGATVRSVEFDESGILKDWPTGFFSAR